MNKMTTALTTQHRLAVTAAEEASRLRQYAIDIDYMFLALVLSEHIAGQVLRSFGITLEKAREAIREQHADQLASLGIRAEMPVAGEMLPGGAGAPEWTPRALNILNQSAKGNRSGDAADVLRELLAESSGFIGQFLSRLDTTPEAVLARLDETDRHFSEPERAPRLDALAGTTESFIPAPVDQLWELLASPSRMPEWEPGVGNVKNPPRHISTGSTWIAHAVTQHPDGKPMRVRPARQTMHVKVTSHAEHQHIEWYFTWPDAPRSNARRIRIELTPAAGGSSLRISTMWVPDPAHARPLGAPLRWMGRFTALRSGCSSRSSAAQSAEHAGEPRKPATLRARAPPPTR